MKDLKKFFENKHVRKVEKVHNLIDDYIIKSFSYTAKSFVQFDKILSSIKPKVEAKKKPTLTIIK